MKYIILTITLFITLSSYGQSDTKIKSFGKSFFEHYKKKDFKWIKAQYGAGNDLDKFWMDLFPNDKRYHNVSYITHTRNKNSYYKSLKESYDRTLMKEAYFNQVLIKDRKIHGKRGKDIKIIFGVNSDTYYIDISMLTQNKKGKIVIISSQLRIGNTKVLDSLLKIQETMAKIEKNRDRYALIPTKGKSLIEPPKPPSLSPKVYDYVAFMPEYPKGEKAMLNFISKNMKYPETAKKSGIAGTVYIDFVVTKDGSITKPKIRRDIGGGCGAEALRVVRKMPKWKPGKNNGKPVNVNFTLPVQFNLPE